MEVKNTIELINRMKEKIAEISQDTELSQEEKEQIVKIRKEFYYELIYNSLEKNSKEDNMSTFSEFGEETKQIFEEMIEYFDKEKENKKHTQKDDSSTK